MVRRLQSLLDMKTKSNSIHPLASVLIAAVILFIYSSLNAATATAQTSAALKQSNSATSCRFDWLRWMDMKEPIAACTNHGVELQKYFESCVQPGLFGRERNWQYQWTRREHLRLLAQQHLFYISRLPTETHGYQQFWSEYQDRWTQQFKREKAVSELDLHPRLGASTCRLHNAFVSHPNCADTKGYSNDPVREQQDRLAFSRTSQESETGLPSRISYQLVRAAFFLKLLQPLSLQDSIEWTLKHVRETPRTKVELKALKDYVYTFYPEFEEDPKLLNLALQALNQSVPVSLLVRKFDEMFPDENPTLDQRNRAIQNLLGQALRARPLSAGIEIQLEGRFLQSMKRIISRIEARTVRGMEDAEWLFTQEYLLSSAVRTMIQSNNIQEAKQFQSFLCTSVRERIKKEERTQKIVKYGSLAGFALFLPGALAMGTVMGTASFVAALAVNTGVGVVEYRHTADRVEQLEGRFYIHKAVHSQLQSARLQASQSNWSNAMAIAATIPLLGASRFAQIRRGADRAVQIAEAAGNVEKAALLRQSAKDIVELERVAQHVNTAVDLSDALGQLHFDNPVGVLVYLGFARFGNKMDPAALKARFKGGTTEGQRMESLLKLLDPAM